MNQMHHTGHSEEHSAMHGAPGGLAISTSGYTLDLASKTLAAGQDERFEFRILDQTGHAVRDFDEQHGERMHLIVIRRDLVHYQHLHPSLGIDGTWSVPLTLPDPGVYRAFADFSVDGEPLTLGTDLFVSGEFRFAPLPSPTGTARPDGYTVALDAGVPNARTQYPLTFRITHEGREVQALEPYLGALGHLVALREGDLAFLHVHPTGGNGSQVTFHAVFPSIGRYRVFLQFAHAGRVHTAAFTIEIAP
jgi:hypothetical protein